MAYQYQNPYYQNPYPQVQAQQTIQTNGFVSVRNEAEARNYPVAYGNSVTFKDENAPYVYTKTMGFSQLETPRFEKYRLVKEDAVQPQIDPSTISDNKNTIDDIQARLRATEDAIDKLNKEVFKPAPKTKKKEVVEDDE